MNAPLSKEQITLLMSDSLTSRPAVRSGRRRSGSFAAPRPTLFARFAAALDAWRQRRVVLDELHNLTDRELMDIGLIRSDLGRVFDPSYARSRDEALFRAAGA